MRAPSLMLPNQSRAIARDLKTILGVGKVKDDGPTLAAYAVDASIYRVVPKAVVLVESEAEISATMQYASTHGIPLTPRAAGTNLTGSAIGSGIILDVSRLNRVLEVNREARWARVQPGVILAELNKQLGRYGLLFGPDPSSGDMCKLGGMLANNSSGPHTLRYGSVRDNVRRLRICLPTGGWLDAQSYQLTEPAFERLLTAFPAVRDLFVLVQSQAEAIRSKKPKVSKNSCGYNLFGLADSLAAGRFDLPQLFVGSEGTLGVVSEATIELVESPKATLTALIHFRRLEEVGEAVPRLLELRPSAMEVMDAHTLDLIGRSKHGIPVDAAATLLIELDSHSPAVDLREEAERMVGFCSGFTLAAEITMAFDPSRREELWRARKALYPTLYRFDALRKPINFVDDVVVPVDRMGELIRYLENFFVGQQVPVAVFGHIGNGNAHILPLLNLNDNNDFQKMIQAYHEIHSTVLGRFGGSICGEHGDGRVRAEYVRQMFGEELYRLFIEVKKAFDPGNLLNPGIKISDRSFTEQIDFTRLSKSCATCAKCNSVCPVYDVFQSEDMSSRGWFEIITAKDYSYLESKRVVEACLNCKSCRTICPAGVDVSDLILQKRAEHPNPLAGWIFQFQAKGKAFESLLVFLGRTQRLWDRPLWRRALEWMTRPVMRMLAQSARLPYDFRLPRLASRLLRERYKELVPAGNVKSTGSGVAYFHGCAANYFDDGVGDAVIGVLRMHDVEPALPPQRCSGTPIQTYGHQGLVQEGARFNLRSLAPYDTIVTGCASCTLMLKDYPSLFSNQAERAQAEQLAKKVIHITEFVAKSPRQPPMAPAAGRTKCATYHSSCHLRAAGVTKEPRKIIASLPGVNFSEMPDADRCAGGAGTFVIKDYETSQKIFARKARAVEEVGAEVVATSCPACMIQFKNGLGEGVEVKHVAQMLHEAYLAGERITHRDS